MQKNQNETNIDKRPRRCKNVYMAFDSRDREKLQYVNVLFGEDKLRFYYSLLFFFRTTLLQKL